MDSFATARQFTIGVGRAKPRYPASKGRLLRLFAAGHLRAARVRDILVSAGADAAGTTSDELAKFLRAEMMKWGKVVKTAGIKPE